MDKGMPAFFVGCFSAMVVVVVISTRCFYNMTDIETTDAVLHYFGVSLNQKKFLAEAIGTFIVVVLATGSVVVDAKTGGSLGLPFIAFARLWEL
jgi:hypothetical protein